MKHNIKIINNLSIKSVKRNIVIYSLTIVIVLDKTIRIAI